MKALGWLGPLSRLAMAVMSVVRCVVADTGVEQALWFIAFLLVSISLDTEIISDAVLRRRSR